VADQFRAAGYQSASIDGGMDDVTRRARIRDLGDGRLQVLTSCEIISEGTDIPVVSAAILLRPTQSLSLALQQMGRALRPFPGKARALILDHAGNCLRHGLPDEDREWSLAGRKRRAKKGSDESNFPVRQCEQCFAVHRPAPVCPSCGFVYQIRARQVEEIEGELQQVDPAEIRRDRRREQARADTIEDLISIGRARGYKNPVGWAHFVWKARSCRRAAA
jgi:superfamily II DNA or RNA helicase